MTEDRQDRLPSEDLEPLDPELARLFAETSFPEPSADARARVFRRAAHAIAASAIGASVAPSILRAIRAHSLHVATATFVLGGAVGAAATVALRPTPAPRVVYIDRPSPSVALPSSAAPPPPVATEAATPSAHREAARPPPAASSFDTLHAERAFIDDARAKLAAGETTVALNRLNEHSRRFPRARLEEEREALLVQALVNMGRDRDARARAKAFHERWPMSVYGPAVDATLESIP